MNAADSNFDTLLKEAARDLLQEDVDLLHSIDTSKTKVSDKTLQRVRKMIKNYDRGTMWSRVPIVCRRAVAAMLVLCSVSFGLCMSVTAVRAEIVNTVMKWYDDFVAIFYITEQTPPSFIEEYREPVLQLAETEKQIVNKNDEYYVIVYLWNNVPVMMYQQKILTSSSLDVDSEDCVAVDIQVGENAAQLFKYDDGRQSITWHDNKYAYIITVESMSIDPSVLISIAESIK